MTDEQITLVLSMGASNKNVAEVREELKKLKSSANDAATATDKATGSTKNLGRAGLEAGRVVQDFAQGGIGGILNNVEGLVSALGGGAGMAGLLTGVGVAAYLAIPAIKSFVSSIVDGANGVPAAADKLDRLNESLAANKSRLDELKKQQSLTNTELSEYNRLMGETGKLEAEIAEERKRRAALESAQGQKTDDQSKIAAAMKGISGGANFDELAMAAAGFSDYERNRIEFTRLDRKEDKSPEEIARRSQLAKWLNANGPGLGKGGSPADVEDMLKRLEEAQNTVLAAREGDAAAFDQLKNLGGDLGDRLNAIDPRQAGKRQFNQDQAKRQAANFLDSTVGNFARQLRDRNDRLKQEAEAKKVAEEEAELDRQTANARSIDAASREYQLSELNRKAEEDAPNQAREAQLRDLTGYLNQQTGGQLPQASLEELAKSTQQLMERGISPVDAARAAMADMVAANQSMMMRVSQIEAGFFDLAAQLQWQAQQNQQAAQTIGTRLGRGR